MSVVLEYLETIFMHKGDTIVSKFFKDLKMNKLPVMVVAAIVIASSALVHNVVDANSAISRIDKIPITDSESTYRSSLLTVLSKPAPLPPRCKEVTFQLWNKTSHPVAVWIGPSIPLNKVPSSALASGTVQNGGYHVFIASNGVAQGAVSDILVPKKKDIVPYLFTFRFFNEKGERLFTDDYPLTYRPEKHPTLYLRLKEEKGKYTFGAQTGTYKGLSGKTESGCEVSKNIFDAHLEPRSGALGRK
jgi:hypothetical protein